MARSNVGQVLDNGSALLAGGQLDSPLRRQLFHIPPEEGGGYGNDPRLCKSAPRMDHV